MIIKPTVLQTMLADDLSSEFLKEFARRLPVIYRESESRSVKDDSVNPALKPYLFWQTRYALVQSLFVDVAAQAGLDVKILKCEANGFPILTVSAGRFTFTTHHSTKADEMMVLNSSLIRQQHSSINNLIVQPTLFATCDESKLKAADRIYGNLIFGCRGNAADWDRFGFLRIGIPYLRRVPNAHGKLVDRLMYADLCDYNDILSLVIDRENSVATKPTVRVVVPKVRRQNPS